MLNIVVESRRPQDSLVKIARVVSNHLKCSYILYWRIPDTRHLKLVFSFYTSYLEFLYNIYSIYNIHYTYIYIVSQRVKWYNQLLRKTMEYDYKLQL